MKLLDYKTVTNKDIFLRKLHGEDVEFKMIANDDLPVFFRVCIKLNLLDFMCQKEYKGTLAIFKITRPFTFSMNLEHSIYSLKSIISLDVNDILTITEILMSSDYYREPGPEHNRNLHTLYFDRPQSHRNKSYKNFNYEI